MPETQQAEEAAGIYAELIQEVEKDFPNLARHLNESFLITSQRFRDREKPESQEDENEAWLEVLKRIEFVDSIYRDWAVRWGEMRMVCPGQTEKILKSRYSIDDKFERWKTGKSNWQVVDKACMDYFSSWIKIPTLFQK